MSRERDTLL